ncbi:hypothetical protein [Methylobacterium oxalidis]|uniref:hypothetical protein n=1 Tax=Methylobacterium oxalidis TaxID=944322 RepID=UPI0011BDE541|nr:hypothetical protein [Methylobacterium oxalidis]GJE33024.1 hypothetical protein LDDCCGHA_3223 [Methylobacterium oxalidis]
MELNFSEPLRVGTCHCLVFQLGASTSDATVDYRNGDSILLHLSLRRTLRRVVINDQRDGRWQLEDEFILTQEEASSELTVRIIIEENGLAVGINMHAPKLLARGEDIHLATTLQFEGNVLFFHNEAERKCRDEVQVPSDDHVPMPRVRIAVSHTDIMHVSGKIWISGETDGHLVFSIDGRPAGMLSLGEITAGKKDSTPEGADFSWEFPENCLVADGMYLTVSLIDQGLTFPLANHRITSKFVGGIDRCSESLVRGWAFNDFLPRRPVNVAIFLNHVYQGTVLANRHRSDIAEIRPEASHCGFVFRFQKTIFLPVGSDVSITTKIHNTTQQLDHSPWHICRHVEPSQLASLRRAALDLEEAPS